jgi:hypothetical protein
MTLFLFVIMLVLRSQAAKVEVRDVLDRVVSIANPLKGKNDWQRFNLQQPVSTGSYFLHIVAGNNVQFLPFTVVR